MSQALECQKCGEFIDIVLTDREMITYHKACWVEFQQELIAIVEKRPWRKLEGSETTEYLECGCDDDKEHEQHKRLTPADRNFDGTF
jgi:hypothetical protein